MKTTFGLVVGNRGFFPAKLCEAGRKTMIQVFESQGYSVVCLGDQDTPYGSVETFAHAQKCAELFKANAERLDGIVVSLPNFGDERAAAEAVRLSGLKVPVLVQAFPDDNEKMSSEFRRDSFCGKISVCNNLRQFGIPYSLTGLHTVDPEGKEFREDLSRFAAICRIVRGLRGARFGQIGARPAAFITVRYSEKILEKHGISVESIDLSEILKRAENLKDADPAVQKKLRAIGAYAKTEGVPASSLQKMARFGVVVDQFMESNKLVGTAIQCWTAMEEHFGIVPCAVMSMLSNALLPSACETDIAGLVGMYALVLAAGQPSALLDWNNNYRDDPDKAIVFHCSNLPQDIFGGQGEMGWQQTIAQSVGKENTYGTISGRIKARAVTYCRVSTEDTSGIVRAYVGEAQTTDDPLQTFGGYGVIRVPGLQKLLRYICENGFEHHVALSPARVAGALSEAMSKYLGWQVYHHQG